MFCKKCGEENPENAVYCRNCGEKLKEEAKKTEIIEELPVNNQTHKNQQTTSTTISSNNGWIACCCIGLFLVFVLSALFSGF